VKAVGKVGLDLAVDDSLMRSRMGAAANRLRITLSNNETMRTNLSARRAPSATST
jgi:hypothetical protein